MILSMVRNMNELEVELNSFQRVVEHSSLESEEQAESTKCPIMTAATPLPASWPANGKVTIHNFSASCTPNGPDVINDLSLETVPGERIAIVGRTGSGKSSLALSLLRFTHRTHGSIVIDNVDTRMIDISPLRRAVPIIPQEPTLFAGNIRSNHDPFDQLEDTELQNVLQECGFMQSQRKKKSLAPASRTYTDAAAVLLTRCHHLTSGSLHQSQRMVQTSPAASARFSAWREIFVVVAKLSY
jgi:ABC-type multidrug transport system fused ATPase/permease subunit